MHQDKADVLYGGGVLVRIGEETRGASGIASSGAAHDAAGAMLISFEESPVQTTLPELEGGGCHPPMPCSKSPACVRSWPTPAPICRR
jgi:hypothetical protein